MSGVCDVHLRLKNTMSKHPSHGKKHSTRASTEWTATYHSFLDAPICPMKTNGRTTGSTSYELPSCTSKKQEATYCAVFVGACSRNLTRKNSNRHVHNTLGYKAHGDFTEMSGTSNWPTSTSLPNEDGPHEETVLETPIRTTAPGRYEI